jgi:hypothetical protein
MGAEGGVGLPGLSTIAPPMELQSLRVLTVNYKSKIALSMTHQPPPLAVTLSALETAQYLRDMIGELARLAQSAGLETTEAMLLVARIEASHAARVLSGWQTNQAAATRPPGADKA